MDITHITEAIRHQRIRITEHADDEAQKDNLTFDEIYFSVLHGQIIESYPTANPYPACLVFGRTFAGEAVHTVWAYNAESGWAVLVTVYRPDPKRWEDWRYRRKPT